MLPPEYPFNPRQLAGNQEVFTVAHIEKRKTKKGETRYRVQITLKGHPRVSETFSTRRDAKRWADRTAEAIRQRRYDPGSKSEQHSVRDLVQRYRQEKLPTLADQVSTSRRLDWWAQQLGWDTTLSHLTPETISAAMDRLAKAGLSGKPLSPSTVRRFLNVLGGAMGAATKDWFWLRENPCTKVRRPSEPRGRMRFLDDDERLRLLCACQESSEKRLYPLVVCALFTGARQGELLQLKWRDVDLERGIATIHHSKNGDRRALAITGQAAVALQVWSQVRSTDIELLFPSRRLTACFPQRAWQAAREAAQIEDFRFHDLRHSFASYLAMSGATLAELAEALGHRSLTMVKRYAHLTEGHTVSVVARMTERFMDESEAQIA